MTEPRLRDLFTWIDAHRLSLIDHAADLAELAALARGADLRSEDLRKQLDRIANKSQLMAMELAAALSALERVHPKDPELDEITLTEGLPPP